MSLLRRRRRGANALEFALTAPVAITILAGMIDFGWFFYQQQGVQTATRDGVRTASVVRIEQDPVTVAENATFNALNRAGLPAAEAKIDATVIINPPNDLIRVTTVMPFSPLFGLVIRDGGLNLHATLSMRLEAQADPDL